MGVGNEMGIGRATKLLLLVCVAVAAVAPLAGQRPSSERNLETDRVTRGPSAPLNRQDAVLTIVKVKGSISGRNVRFGGQLHHDAEHSAYHFDGQVTGNEIAGDVDLGEYGMAKFRAWRHEYGKPTRKDPSVSGKTEKI